MSTANTNVNYAIDAAGNLTSDGLRTFEYDAANRLAKAKIFKDGEEASIRYLHNAVGQRVFKGEPTASQTMPSETDLGTSFIDWLKKNFKWLYANAQANTSIGTAYVYGDGEIPSWALLGEYDNGSAKGAGRSEFIWLPTEDGSAIPVGMFRNGKLFAIHSDHLGTPRLMTDEANKPVWQWPYSAFGTTKPTGILKATPNPRAAITNIPVLLKATGATEMTLRFPGQEEDLELGMRQNFHRIFRQSEGRYSQADPIGLSGGLNRFLYADANPLHSFDPDGLQVIVVPVPSRGPRANPDFPPGVGPNHQSDSVLQELIEREANRREYKNRCDEKPPQGLNQCELAKWNLKKAKECRAFRLENTKKWWGGRDERHSAQLEADLDNAALNAERAVKRACKDCD